jgi:RNA polymerase sigma-70 factor, ECF subfamily
MLTMPEREQLPVDEARAGDPDAWAALFERFQLPLYVYVVELVREEQASLDVVQETFVAAVQHVAGLRDKDKFGSWLFGIAHQKCIQRWRKHVREEEALDKFADASDESEDAPDERLVRQEQEAEFLALLAGLPVPQRAVLLLFYVEEFSLEEIARVTQTSTGTVKSRLHYAKKAVRKLLGHKLR